MPPNANPNLSEQLVVPEPLVRSIREGRCVAFVGAGFSAAVTPGWQDLLKQTAKALGCFDAEHPIHTSIAGASAAFELEVAGQMLREACSDTDFERAIQQVLHRAPNEQLTRRIQTLQRIPFEAILTTNFDSFLDGHAPAPELYAQILRDRTPWWQAWNEAQAWQQRPVVKLHGDANGDPLLNPVVLSRADYRRRIYGEGGYANFLRSIFATRTVLFLGVSFTDAYLNELRSEALAHLSGQSTEPVGYAIMDDRSPATQAYFREHEGIEILPYRAEPNHQQFDDWLDCIYKKSAPLGRMAELLNNRHVVWMDRADENNRRGAETLRQAGVQLEMIQSPQQLQATKHQGADLILSHFGYRPEASPVVHDLFERINSWSDRPPVIVFASRNDGNRKQALRYGAFEYAWTWGELFRSIDELFERKLGG